MRLTNKLSLIAVAVLLANCALPSDQSVQSGGSAISSAETKDSRAGLTWIDGASKQARLSRSNAVADAIAYLSSAAEGAGVSGPEFKVLNVTDKDPADGLTHVRVQQTFQGTLVWGADSVVHLDGDSVLGASGTIATKLAGTNMTAVLSATDVLSRAKADRYGDRQVMTSRESVERVVHVDDTGTAHIALHTSFFNELQGDIEPAYWHHIYDANTGDVLARWNDIHTLDQASGPSGNPKITHAWSHELDVEASGTQFVLTTAKLKTVNMNQGSSTQTEVTGSLDNIGDAPINDAHGYAEVTLNMMHDWQNRESIDDHGFQILSRVHYGHAYENAFWDGTEMTYGDGANTFYPLSGGVDVCGHEINHGYTQRHSGLAYSGEAGGLNEGFSDIAGKTTEFYYKQDPNFDIGVDVFKQAGRALRYMCNPTADGRSIDKASSMTSGLDPHYSSGVPNKAFCRSAKRLSSGDPEAATATRDGVKRASQAFYLANGQYWTSSSTYIKGCQGTLDAARALHFSDDEVNYIKLSWADVGVACN